MFASFLSLAALAGFLLQDLASAQSVNGATYNHPSSGPPPSFFAASRTVNVQALKTAAAHASGVPKSAVYPVNNNGNSPTATIHDDWMNFPTVSSSMRFPFLGGGLEAVSRSHRRLTWAT
jgi:chitosanase